jgi:peptidase E
MTADTPTILATSGGLFPSQRNYFEFGPLLTYAIDLAGVAGRAPRVCLVNTAGGDQAWFAAYFHEAGRMAGAAVSELRLFTMPNVDDMAGFVLDQDVIWVSGGSVANLLALWRLHGLDEIFRQAWQAGVVLTGVSAGSICWHVGGTTDSFGPDLRAVTNGLAFLRSFTVSSRTAPCPAATPPTTGRGCCTGARIWPRRSPRSAARAPTRSPSATVRSMRSPWRRGCCPAVLRRAPVSASPVPPRSRPGPT